MLVATFQKLINRGELLEEKMKRLTGELSEQFKRSDKLEAEIKKNLEGLGFNL